MGDPSPHPRRWTWPEMISAWAAALGLIAALLFNGLQLRTANAQSRQSDRTAQLQLLDSVGLDYAKARASGTDAPVIRAMLTNGQRIGATPGERGLYDAVELESILAEQYAYLLNRHYVDLPGAIKTGPLVCTWRRVVAVQRRDYAEYLYEGHGLPELYRFEQEHAGESLERCRMPARPAG